MNLDDKVNSRLDWWVKRTGPSTPRAGKRLENNHPEILGWPEEKPLPKRFTSYSDPENPIGEGNAVSRRMVISRELEPLIYDDRPTFIDLFAGCGGFSLGFIRAGWRCVAMVEYEYWPTVTYCSNIPHNQEAPLHIYKEDIRNINGRDILHRLNRYDIDAVVGGPPCQSFSSQGKRDVGDPRDTLLWQFGRLVKEIKPNTFVMENVPEIKSKKLPDGRKVIDAWLEYMDMGDEEIPAEIKRLDKFEEVRT